ncbi:MAG: hypothetical protein QM831_06875 [Kofleriaceae bacterium]
MSDNNGGVVNLVDAEVPADQGLAALGMLMRLGGNVMAALGSLFAVTLLMSARGARGNDLFLMLLVVGGSIVRSIIHSQAGSQLVHGDPRVENSHLLGVRRYIAVALIQSCVVALILQVSVFHEIRTTIAVFAGLLVWPTTLAILFKLPRFARFTTQPMPVPEDKGFEGAAILMTVFGVCGTIATATGLVLMMKSLSTRELQSGPVVMLLFCLVLLVIRSALHAHAGISGLRETSVDHSVELANRYTNFGIISGFCVGGLMLILVMMTSRPSVDGMAAIVGVTWMLLTWPMIIRRFFSDRQFNDILAGDQAPIHRRSPDAGLTWLGWFLFAYAGFEASFLVVQMIGGSGAGMAARFNLFSAFGMRSIWFSVGMVLLQGWAGFELVRMSPQARAVASVFGVVATGLTLWTAWPLMKEIKHVGDPNDFALMFGPLALALVIPIATVVLVNRKIAPTARARYRNKE